MIFDIIKAFILILPLGIFLTFTFMVLINSAIKVRRANVMLRKVTGYYCFSATVASFMLLAYYYMPALFSLLDVIFATSVIFSMVLFYHFLHYATTPNQRFNPLHYIIPSLVFVILLIIKLLLPEIWAHEGVRGSMIIALLFGVVYSLFPLAGMQRYYMEQSLEQGKPFSINILQATMYIVEVILFPVVFAFFPLIGGQTPGVFISLLLMLTVLLALKANIPFTYAMTRHYTSLEMRQHSLFEDKITATDENILKQQPIVIEKKLKKNPEKQPKKSLPPGFDKKMFNSFIRSRKPYLNPDLTIIDVAEMLESNRTYISEFVNRAYGMNFRNYINLCRLREMNRLLALPKHKERPPAELIPQTGFGTMRNYLRTKRQFVKQAQENQND